MMRVNSCIIQQKENEMEYLKIQYVARVLFNKAEKLNYYPWALCIVALVFTFVPNRLLWVPNELIQICIDFVAFCLSCKMEGYLKMAALLRKYFDAQVLDIHPERFSKSEIQDIFEETEEVCAKNKEEMQIQTTNTGRNIPPGVKDWYEFSSFLDGTKAQFECQCQNAWWNKKLSKFRKKIFPIVGLSFVIYFFVTRLFGISALSAVVGIGGVIVKYVERCYCYWKCEKLSLKLDGAIGAVESNPQIEHIEAIQVLIDERRSINVLEINLFHKYEALKLSCLYSNSKNH